MRSAASVTFLKYIHMTGVYIEGFNKALRFYGRTHGDGCSF